MRVPSRRATLSAAGVQGVVTGQIGMRWLLAGRPGDYGHMVPAGLAVGPTLLLLYLAGYYAAREEGRAVGSCVSVVPHYCPCRRPRPSLPLSPFFCSCRTASPHPSHVPASAFLCLLLPSGMGCFLCWTIRHNASRTAAAMAGRACTLPRLQRACTCRCSADACVRASIPPPTLDRRSVGEGGGSWAAHVMGSAAWPRERLRGAVVPSHFQIWK